MSATPIEVIPGQGLGGIRIGTPISEISKIASINNQFGHLDDIEFSIMDGKVAEVWINDLRKTKAGISIEGSHFSPDLSLEEIKQQIGPCVKLTGIKGGIFFRCRSGLLLGTDPFETGTFIQLRVVP